MTRRRRRGPAGTAAGRRSPNACLAPATVPSKSARAASSLVTDDRARHPDRGALLPQRPGRGVDPVGRRHDEERGVRGPQPGAELADEVGVAGGVDEVDHHAVRSRRTRRPSGWTARRSVGRGPAARGRRRRPGARTGWSCRSRCGRRARRCGAPPAGWRSGTWTRPTRPSALVTTRSRRSRASAQTPTSAGQYAGPTMLNRFARAFFTKLLHPRRPAAPAARHQPRRRDDRRHRSVCASAPWPSTPRHEFFWGTLVITVFVFSDTVDGVMARMSGRSGKLGRLPRLHARPGRRRRHLRWAGPLLRRRGDDQLSWPASRWPA